MTPRLLRSFEGLEREKSALLAEIATWSPARLSFRPDPASWSTLQMLDHVVKVEASVLRNMRNNLSAANKVTFRDRIGCWFVLGVMRSRVRVKVPAAARGVVPSDEMNPLLVNTRWLATRRGLSEVLKSVSASQLCCGVFRHPVSGWMTLPNTMAFLNAHLSHHLHQFARLKQASQRL